MGQIRLRSVALPLSEEPHELGGRLAAILSLGGFIACSHEHVDLLLDDQLIRTSVATLSARRNHHLLEVLNLSIVWFSFARELHVLHGVLVADEHVGRIGHRSHCVHGVQHILRTALKEVAATSDEDHVAGEGSLLQAGHHLVDIAGAEVGHIRSGGYLAVHFVND